MSSYDSSSEDNESHEDMEQKILAILNEGRSLHDILQELVELRELETKLKKEVAQFREQFLEEERARAAHRVRLRVPGIANETLPSVA